MTLDEGHEEYDLLKGNINRMFITDDVEELAVMHKLAKDRIEKIFNYNCARIRLIPWLNNKC